VSLTEHKATALSVWESASHTGMPARRRLVADRCHREWRLSGIGFYGVYKAHKRPAVCEHARKTFEHWLVLVMKRS